MEAFDIPRRDIRNGRNTGMDFSPIINRSTALWYLAFLAGTQIPLVQRHYR